MLSEYRVTNCYCKYASLLGKTYGISHKKFYDIFHSLLNCFDHLSDHLANRIVDG